MFLRKIRLSCLLLCFALLPYHASQSARSQYRVNPNDFDSFWIWGNIKTAPYLIKAKEVYILQGEVRFDKTSKQSILIPQGIPVVKIPHQKIWLVFRNHHLNWQNKEREQILKRIQQWENSGNSVQGIQIDFDARTKHLKDYALFLEELRAKLPKKYRLSITGLLDWTNVDDIKTLNLLKANIDELVIQTYQASTTIPNYRQYLSRISKLNLPYKVGYVQNGIWEGQFNPNNPLFKGNVIFLLREQ